MFSSNWRCFPISIAFLSGLSLTWSDPSFAAEELRSARPLIRKLGTIDLDLVETTPIVFNGGLYRFEWVREGYWNNQRKTNYFRFIDHESGEVKPPFADGHEFGSAFVHGKT